jgi:hypothetical protein
MEMWSIEHVAHNSLAIVFVVLPWENTHQKVMMWMISSFIDHHRQPSARPSLSRERVFELFNYWGHIRVPTLSTSE